MIFNKNKKAFNLVEILLSMTIIAILAVGFLPVLTKRAHRSADPDCQNGFKQVQEIRTVQNQSDILIPDNLASEVTITLVGGGQGGVNPSFEYKSVNANAGSCNLQAIPDTSEVFYSNVYFSAVKDGKDANCASSQAGASGDYINNLFIEAEKGKSYSYDTITSTSQGFSISSWSSGIAGGVSTGDAKLIFLRGGVPPVNINNGGIGQSCKWSDDENVYKVFGSRSYAACQISYKEVTPQLGGSSGAYAKFIANKVLSNVKCEVHVGHGGSPFNFGADSIAGGDTSITCGNDVQYMVLGGGSTTEVTGNKGYANGTIVTTNPQNGNLLDTSIISGGRGADVTKEDNKIFSQGGLGGCDGAISSLDCAKPNGASGINGSGGGGGSCNENGCGAGGKGGDGLVVIEYKVRCD